MAAEIDCHEANGGGYVELKTSKLIRQVNRSARQRPAARPRLRREWRAHVCDRPCRTRGRSARRIRSRSTSCSNSGCRASSPACRASSSASAMTAAPCTRWRCSRRSRYRAWCAPRRCGTRLSASTLARWCSSGCCARCAPAQRARVRGRGATGEQSSVRARQLRSRTHPALRQVSKLPRSVRLVLRYEPTRRALLLMHSDHGEGSHADQAAPPAKRQRSDGPGPRGQQCGRVRLQNKDFEMCENKNRKGCHRAQCEYRRDRSRIGVTTIVLGGVKVT
eukprot:3236306-Prymnesium_polylepis.1